jgi:hypothetical protein
MIVQHSSESVDQCPCVNGSHSLGQLGHDGRGSHRNTARHALKRNILYHSGPQPECEKFPARRPAGIRSCAVVANPEAPSDGDVIAELTEDAPRFA